MPKGRWKTDFSADYAKLRNRTDRFYGEREYGDKFREEKSPGMLRDAEPDYEMHVKPYKQREAEAEQEKAEAIEVDRLVEQTESSPMEDEMLKIKSENIWEPLEPQPVDSEPKKKDAEPEQRY